MRLVGNALRRFELLDAFAKCLCAFMRKLRVRNCCGLVWSIALKCARLFGPGLERESSDAGPCIALDNVWATANAIETRCISNLSIASI